MHLCTIKWLPKKISFRGYLLQKPKSEIFLWKNKIQIRLFRNGFQPCRCVGLEFVFYNLLIFINQENKNIFKT
jgi:hypothetical protein